MQRGKIEVFEMKTEKLNMIGKTIDTAWGQAVYHHTEVEENGKWDDHWLMKNGEFVIHNGDEHDVYLLIKETCGGCGNIKKPVNLCSCGGRCYEFMKQDVS